MIFGLDDRSAEDKQPHRIYSTLLRNIMPLFALTTDSPAPPSLLPESSPAAD